MEYDNNVNQYMFLFKYMNNFLTETKKKTYVPFIGRLVSHWNSDVYKQTVQVKWWTGNEAIWGKITVCQMRRMCCLEMNLPSELIVSKLESVTQRSSPSRLIRLKNWSTIQLQNWLCRYSDLSSTYSCRVFVIELLVTAFKTFLKLFSFQPNNH